MTSISDFLLARIAEDEELAQLASADRPDPWVARGIGADPEDIDRVGAAAVMAVGYDMNRRPAEHVARWAPARALAECEAKRCIIAECRGACAGGCCDYWVNEGLCETLKLLAGVYADHADYEEAWRFAE